MTTAVTQAGALGAIAAKFRTCPATGLKVDLAAALHGELSLDSVLGSGALVEARPNACLP